MSSLTLEDEIDAYLRHGKTVGWRDSTLENYGYLLGLSVRALRRRGCMHVAEVTHEDLQAVMEAVSQEGRARKTRVQLAVVMKQAFTWLQEQGKIVRNPALGLPMPDDGEEPLADPPLSENEVQALFALLPRRSVVDLRNACLLELLYGCGLRRSEGLGLDLPDIDLTRRTVCVRNGKGGQDRVVPLMSTAAASVKDYLAVRRTLLKGPDRGALFLNKWGTRAGERCLYEYLKALNAARGPGARHLYPHLFRHSIAVHLLRGKADIRYIQDFLGHADLNTTKNYLRLVPGHLRDDYDAAMPDIAVMPSLSPLSAASPIPQ